MRSHRCRPSLCLMALAVGIGLGSGSAGSASARVDLGPPGSPPAVHALAAQDACADVEFLGARGSGEPRTSGHGLGREVDYMASRLAGLLRADGETLQRHRVAYSALGTETSSHHAASSRSWP